MGLKKGLSRARKSQQSYRSISANQTRTFHQQELQQKITGMTDQIYNRIEKIIHTCLEHSKAKNLGVFNEKDELIAVGFFPNSHHRIINLFNASNSKGRQYNAISFVEPSY